MLASSASPAPQAGPPGAAGGGAVTGACGIAVAAIAGGATDADVWPCCPGAVEQADTSADIATTAHRARDPEAIEAMGLDTSRKESRFRSRGRRISPTPCTPATARTRVHLRTWAACYVDRMDRFLVPAAASIVVGLLLGAAAVFGVTLMVQQDNKPPLQAGDPASSVLNRVEYGDRT
jgi:hypothetical protein